MFTEVRLFKREIDQVYNNCHSGFDTAILKNSVLIIELLFYILL